MGIIKAIYFLIRAFLLPRLILAAENLALRQQVAVYKHAVKRPKLRVVTGSSGFGSLGSGRTGDQCWPLSSRKRSSNGIGKALSSIGDGSLEPGNPADLPSNANSGT